MSASVPAPTLCSRLFAPLLAVGAGMVVVSCATHETAVSVNAPVAPQSMPAAAGAIPPARPLPYFKPDSHDYYPTTAKRQGLTGRVLVEFGIDPSGRPTAATVVAADADPVLQSAALNVVGRLKFKLPDPAYDPADPAPVHLAVVFCIEKCGPLVPYAGYEKVAVVITTGILRRP